MLTQYIRRLYVPELMIAKDKQLGKMPSTKEAYNRTLQIALPAVSEAFLVSLVSIVDTQMVSSIGTEAIAAVALVTQPRFLIMSIVMALNISVTSVVARRKGEKDPDSANRCLRQSMILCVAISVFMSFLSYIFRYDILRFMGAMPDTIEMSAAYFEVLLIGIPANCLSLTICAAQKGSGYTKISMQVNVVANLINVFFNYMLIGGKLFFPRLETRGAAIATVIGWACGLLLALISVLPRDGFVSITSKSGWKFDRLTLLALFTVFSGSVVELLFMRVGMVAYSRMVAGLGTVMLAANTIGMNLLTISFSIGDGVGVAASALVGFHLGERRPDLSMLYGRTCQRIALVCCTMLFFCYTFGGGFLYSLFSDDPAIVSVGRQIMTIAGIVTFAQASHCIYLGILRGAGDTKYTAIMSMVCLMIVRPTLAWTLIYRLGLGLIGGWCALLFDQNLRLVFTYFRFRSGRWASIKL